MNQSLQSCHLYHYTSFLTVCLQVASIFACNVCCNTSTHCLVNYKHALQNASATMAVCKVTYILVLNIARNLAFAIASRDRLAFAVASRDGTY
jgi:hypothetical protein